MKNKRGDISIAILVIGIFALCLLTVFSFLNFNIRTQNSFNSINYVEYTNLQYEESLFRNTEKALFYNELNETKYVPWSKDVLKFSVQYEPIG